MSVGPITLLREVDKFLRAPGRWCRGAVARTSSGQACTHLDRHAYSYSLLGALMVAAGRHDLSWSGPNARATNAAVRALREELLPAPARGETGHTAVADWCDDDGRTLDEVLGLIATAIRQLQSDTTRRSA